MKFNILGVAVLLTFLSGARAPAQERFSGALKVRQENGELYYLVTVAKGRVVSGYVTFTTEKEAVGDVVGGWYDGGRLVLMVQLKGDKIDDPFFSHIHHFKIDGRNATLEHSLMGYGTTLKDKNLYRPHIVDEVRKKQ